MTREQQLESGPVDISHPKLDQCFLIGRFCNWHAEKDVYEHQLPYIDIKTWKRLTWIWQSKLCALGLLQFSFCARTDCSFSSRRKSFGACGLAANRGFWLTAPFFCTVLLHFPLFPFRLYSHYLEQCLMRLGTVDFSKYICKCLNEPQEQDMRLKMWRINILRFLLTQKSERSPEQDVVFVNLQCHIIQHFHRFLIFLVKWWWEPPSFSKCFVCSLCLFCGNIWQHLLLFAVKRPNRELIACSGRVKLLWK